MRNFVISFSIVGLALVLSQCTPTMHPNTSTPKVTTADYERAVKYMDKNMSQYVYDQIVSEKWLNDKQYLYQIRTQNDGNQFMIADIDNQTKKLAFDHTKLATALGKVLNKPIDAKKLPFNSYEVKKNVIEMMISGKKYSCDLNSYECIVLTDNLAKSHEMVSPNGKLVAYIQDYNLWIRNLETNQKTQLTFDGQKDYGYATNNAGWIKSNKPVLTWSKNSDKIATFRQDARKVGEMYMATTNVGHPHLEAWKYELPGDSAAFMIERIVINLTPQPQLVRLQDKPDVQRSTITDHIAGNDGSLLDVEFSADGSKLAYISSSRDHKIAELKVADTQTGTVEWIMKEESPTNFESGVNKINWHVLFDSNEILWYATRDDWGHLYLYDLKTKQLKNRITTGNWAVQQVLYVDNKNREIFFIGQGREAGNPYHRYLYKVSFDGKNLTLLTPEQGSHKIEPNANWSYFSDTYSSTLNAPKTVIRDRNGKVLINVAQADITHLKTKGWVAPIEFSVKARDGKTDLYGILYLPSHYDKNKRYPIVNYIYPGPQIGSVNDYSFSAGKRDHQAMAELGMAVFTLDGMGTIGRSKSFEDAYYGNMGDNGLPDQMTGIRQMSQRYTNLDTTRIGIWGRSGGGFASADAILRYPDFYKVAFSIAGNHDNRNYEADWGEKWHGLLKKNSDGTTNYDDQANQRMAKNLKGKLMLAHGAMDTNVPHYNTFLVVEELIKANKDFDLLIFPNKGHRFDDMQNYLTRRIWDYFVQHLIGAEPPKEFLIE